MGPASGQATVFCVNAGMQSQRRSQTPKAMPVLVSVFSLRMHAAGSTPVPAHSVALLISTRLILAAVGAGEIETRHLGLAGRQVLEVEHGQPVDDAGLVEQGDLERRLGEVGAESVVDHEGQAAALFGGLRAVELEGQRGTGADSCASAGTIASDIASVEVSRRSDVVKRAIDHQPPNRMVAASFSVMPGS